MYIGEVPLTWQFGPYESFERIRGLYITIQTHQPGYRRKGVCGLRTFIEIAFLLFCLYPIKSKNTKCVSRFTSVPTADATVRIRNCTEVATASEKRAVG
jgi:hypothetical protein